MCHTTSENIKVLGGVGGRDVDISGLGAEVLRNADYIHYFDDFRHNVPQSIPLDRNDGWSGIVAELFHRTDPNLSTNLIKELDPRKRKTAISKVEAFLNSTLTREWEQFHLEERDVFKYPHYIYRRV